ncbi:Nucleotidyl transferase [Rhodovulum sp. P5]|uniref:nucleotidyltransferase family protein n=1 Tax=Rhodovulum sp. P5 TaxID=1564506 RepID=UPI0009C1AF81|nr:nucleotidyltransferase family protein [Rhodovulum sp. P5]ARE40587.1 Nucleotidyl transferase [Rhodovulum sp. P5]
MRPDAVMLFAAGFGTRMGALTATRPKPLIEVAGRPLIDHALALVDEAGIGRCVVNTHYLADQIHAHLRGRGDVLISHESPRILDTGGGLLQALPRLDGDAVFTLNSDAVWTGNNPLTQLTRAWEPEKMDALLLLVPPGNARGHTGTGDFVMSADGRLCRGPGAIYTGAQILKTATLADPPADAFSLNVIWDRLLQDGRLYGAVHAGGWCDVGHPGGIAMAEAMLAGTDDV